MDQGAKPPGELVLAEVMAGGTMSFALPARVHVSKVTQVSCHGKKSFKQTQHRCFSFLQAFSELCPLLGDSLCFAWIHCNVARSPWFFRLPHLWCTVSKTCSRLFTITLPFTVILTKVIHYILCYLCTSTLPILVCLTYLWVGTKLLTCNFYICT